MALHAKKDELVITPSDIFVAKAAKMTEEPVHLFAEKAMKRFGSYVIQHRALPDFRDGFKPVQRRTMWAMYELKLFPGQGTKKSARIVGDVIGKYNPHGDKSAYDALVRIVNNSVNLINGQGNFGPYNSLPAAFRYTEASLTKFSMETLFKKDYLEVTPMHPNYDGSETEPLILPALLPIILLNGFLGIAVGVSGGIPPYKLEGVLALIKMALENKQITPKDCVNNLKTNFPFGGIVDSTKQEWLDFYKTGQGYLRILPKYHLNENKMIITEVPPHYDKERDIKTIQNFPDVIAVSDTLDKKSGVTMEVKFHKDLGENLETRANELAYKLASRMVLLINVTKKINGDVAEFKPTNMPDLIHEWTKWRIELEKSMLTNRINNLKKDLNHNKVLLLATKNLKTIFKVLQSKVNSLEDALAKELKITVDQAKIILGLQVRSLSRLSQVDILKEIEKIKLTISKDQQYLANPNQKIIKELPEFIKLAA